jgi:hypothetical protein
MLKNAQHNIPLPEIALKISGDRALENALLTSKSSWHCLYFGSRNQGVAKTFLNSNRFYCLPTTMKYENSIHLHEVVHTDGCQGLPQVAAYLASCISNAFGIPDRHDDHEFFDLMFVYNAEAVELFEAVAYHLQIASSATPLDLKEAIIADLKTHNPSRLSLTLQLNDTVNRMISRKVGSKTKDDLWKLPLSLVRLACATKDWVKERVFDRFRVMRDLKPTEIPQWRNLDQLYNSLGARLLERRFQIVEMRSPRSIVSDANLWVWFRRLISEMGSTTPLRPSIFGFLRQLDPTFGPIGFVCHSLETLSEKKVNYCNLGQNLRAMNPNRHFQRRRADLKKVLSDKLILGSGAVPSLKSYELALHQLTSVKKEVAMMCPGLRHCKRESECRIEEEVYRRISQLWF